MHHIFASLPEIKHSSLKNIFEPYWPLGVDNLKWTEQIFSPVPPTILKIPVDVHSPIGSQAQFDCVADGNPTPIVKWQRDNIPVQLTTSHKHQVTSAGSLIIQEVSHIDEGVYECIAENVAGVVQASAQLTVWGEFVLLSPVFSSYFLILSEVHMHQSSAQMKPDKAEQFLPIFSAMRCYISKLFMKICWDDILKFDLIRSTVKFQWHVPNIA